MLGREPVSLVVLPGLLERRGEPLDLEELYPDGFLVATVGARELRVVGPALERVNEVLGARRDRALHVDAALVAGRVLVAAPVAELEQSAQLGLGAPPLLIDVWVDGRRGHRLAPSRSLRPARRA